MFAGIKYIPFLKIVDQRFLEYTTNCLNLVKNIDAPMTHPPPRIYFYVPQHRWPSSENIDKLRIDEFGYGSISWTFQTYYFLKKAGLDCTLTADFPTSGIVLAYRMALAERLIPAKDLLVVCLKGDENWHPFAQLHVVQNPHELKAKYRHYGKRVFMRHWPQSSLTPRDPARGNRFETIAYYGREQNLAPELRSDDFRKELASLGLELKIVSDATRWGDYSNVDAILAVRKIGPVSFEFKPATKLYQAWHAGVPAIVGRESAFLAERKSELDFIEASSVNEVLSALKHLRDDAPYRARIVDNARTRAKETSEAALVEEWLRLLNDEAIPGHREWKRRSRTSRYGYVLRRCPHFIRIKLRRLLRNY
jgi:hypothetical protein